jgi:hypothetical protein
MDFGDRSQPRVTTITSFQPGDMPDQVIILPWPAENERKSAVHARVSGVGDPSAS